MKYRAWRETLALIFVSSISFISTNSFASVTCTDPVEQTESDQLMTDCLSATDEAVKKCDPTLKDEFIRNEVGVAETDTDLLLSGADSNTDAGFQKRLAHMQRAQKATELKLQYCQSGVSECLKHCENWQEKLSRKACQFEGGEELENKLNSCTSGSVATQLEQFKKENTVAQLEVQELINQEGEAGADVVGDPLQNDLKEVGNAGLNEDQTPGDGTAAEILGEDPLGSTANNIDCSKYIGPQGAAASNGICDGYGNIVDATAQNGLTANDAAIGDLPDAYTWSKVPKDKQKAVANAMIEPRVDAMNAIETSSGYTDAEMQAQNNWNALRKDERRSINRYLAGQYTGGDRNAGIDKLIADAKSGHARVSPRMRDYALAYERQRSIHRSMVQSNPQYTTYYNEIEQLKRMSYQEGSYASNSTSSGGGSTSHCPHPPAEVQACISRNPELTGIYGVCCALGNDF